MNSSDWFHIISIIAAVAVWEFVKRWWEKRRNGR